MCCTVFVLHRVNILRDTDTQEGNHKSYNYHIKYKADSGRYPKIEI